MAAEVEISRESAKRILKVDLSLKFYKMQAWQLLSNTDNERKLQFCQHVNGLSEERRLNESHIYLNVLTYISCHFLTAEMDLLEVFRSR